uniref:NADH-ubiquinone oxidoreductase chain 2 n=1 Tax=Cephalodiscus hodgsoni TaxID=560606 RepID=A0A481P7W8_9BILA|nr:NADH dehydrogenase subunit 2 [Cephalodiscus hodgsoni]
MNIYITLLFTTTTTFSITISLISTTPLIPILAITLTSLAFLNLLNTSNKTTPLLTSNAQAKYLLIQLTSFCMLYPLIPLSLQPNANSLTTNTLLILGTLIPLTIWPNHIYAIELIRATSPTIILIFLTIQKIIPLHLISLPINSLPTTLIPLLITAALLSDLTAINQTNLLKLLSLSSSSQLAWLIIAYPLAPKLIKINFIIYTVITITIINSIKQLKTPHTKQLLITPPKNPLSLTIAILSLSGIPPFLGAFIKLSILTLYTKTSSIIISLTLSLIALASIYLYVHIALLFLEKTTPKLFSENPNNNPKQINIPLIINSLSLPIAPLTTQNI